MSSDFAAAGRIARDLIRVPDVPFQSIRGRARSAQTRGRLAALAACVAISVVVVAAGTGAGAKLYAGARFWLYGDKVASAFDSAVYMREPTGSELRDAIAHATFPVVFPVGLRPSSRVRAVTIAPIGRPSFITVDYEGAGSKPDRFGRHQSFALVDPAVVDPAGTLLPALSARSSFRTVEHWRAGGEIVLIGDEFISRAELDRVKSAMTGVTSSDSLAATEARLPKVLVIGGPVRLEIAERYRPAAGRSVLVGATGMQMLPKLIGQHAPLLDARFGYFTNLIYGNGEVRGAKRRPTHIIAISADGVRAIGAVLHASAKGTSANDCGCEILFNQPNPATYWIWTIPLQALGAPQKYVVDARTFAVTP